MTRTPRTLTEVLAGFDADQLAELIRERLDLGYPLPRHISELAAQATTPLSVQRAIDTLNAWQLAVIKALAVCRDPSDTDGVAKLLGVAGQPVSQAVAILRRLALVWGDDQQIHLVRAARDQFGNYPAGLAPPSPAPLNTDAIDAAIAASGTDAQPVLRRLTWGPPTGSVNGADRQITVAAARTPVEKLLAHRILRPIDRDTVVLAQEVALRLRSLESDWLLDGEPVSPEPPQPSGTVRAGRASMIAAVGAAHELTHDMEQLIAELDASPPRLLRDGSVSIRDVRAISRRFNQDTAYTGFLLECGAAAGLINTREDRLLPTSDGDSWLTADGPRQWQIIATAWRDGTRWFGTAEPGLGQEQATPDDEDPDGQLTDRRTGRRAATRPLAADDHAPNAPRLRRVLIDVAAAAPVGSVLDLDFLTAAVGWHLPVAARDPERLRRLIGSCWHQAAWLGLVALGASTRLLPTLREDATVPTELGALFPEPVQHVIIQSDLTAVAQGPLEYRVARVLRLLADQESRGGGAVFRFGPASLRRGFDAGWSGTDVTEWLTRHSSTGIPQPLSYLIDDAARQHGAIRVGGAASYLRIEDPAQQAAIVSHPDATGLQLRAIAPGVLVSAAEPDEVVTVLRRLGLQPAPEDEQGRLLTTRPQRRARRPATVTDDHPPVDPRQAAAAILAAEHQQSPAHQIQEHAQLLRHAADTGSAVRVSIVDSQGDASERSIIPITVADGTVRAHPPGSAQILSVPIWQFSRVAPEEGEESQEGVHRSM